MMGFVRVGIVTLAAVALTGGPASAQPKAPGVTDTEIVIGLTAPMSGPAAIYGNLAVAKEAWARYVNDLGGVHGRKLKVAIKDDGFNPGRAVAKVGYRPRLVGSFTIGDHQVMYRLLGELWEGAYYNVIGAVPGEPEAKAVLDILIKYEPKLQGREGTALAGAANMIIAVEGLKKAGRNLTRDGFIEAMEGIRDFTVLGLSAPISFGPDRHHGLNAVRLMRAQKPADFS